jgi:hypothetical protein
MASHPQRHGNVVEYGEVRIQRVGLEHHRKIAAAGTNPVDGRPRCVLRLMSAARDPDAQQCRLAQPEGPISAMNSPSSIAKIDPLKFPSSRKSADGLKLNLCHLAGAPTAMQQRADD